MGNLGNVFGYGAGYLDLGHWSGIAWVHGGQFRKLAVLSCFVMVALVAVTCVTQPERRDREQEEGKEGVSWRKAVRNIRESVRHLPKPIRRVCYGTLLGRAVSWKGAERILISPWLEL